MGSVDIKDTQMLAQEGAISSTVDLKPLALAVITLDNDQEMGSDAYYMWEC